jgi:hypothetical protein
MDIHKLDFWLLDAYALGYYDGRHHGSEDTPEDYDDEERYLYKVGYQRGVTDYCHDKHPETQS